MQEDLNKRNRSGGTQLGPWVLAARAGFAIQADALRAIRGRSCARVRRHRTKAKDPAIVEKGELRRGMNCR